ncbi:MAG: hypothetical protein U5R31_02865 [Acidimicrobiia bacterium]|nr:hypothetical protein [Acidimicrobiia bacterium]
MLDSDGGREQWFEWVSTLESLSADPVLPVIRREVFDVFAFGLRRGRRHAIVGRLASWARACRALTRSAAAVRPAPVVIVAEFDRATDTTRALEAELSRVASTPYTTVTPSDVRSYVRPLGPERRAGRWFDELVGSVRLAPAPRSPGVPPPGRIGRSRLLAARRFLAHTAPEVVVTTRDQQPLPAALAMAARERGIPSLALQHGSMAPVVNLPVNVFRYAVWGDYTRDELVAEGADPDRLVACGSPRHDALLRQASRRTAQEARTRLGLATDRPVFVYFSSGHARVLPRDVLEAMETWIARIASMLGPTWAVVVKPHPSESAQPWRNAGVTVLGTDPDTTTDALVAATVVGGSYTTVLEEATLLRRPALQLLGDRWPDLVPLWRVGGTVLARSPEDAVAWLTRVGERGCDEETVAAQADFARAAFAQRGRASAAIADLVEELRTTRNPRATDD